MSFSALGLMGTARLIPSPRRLDLPLLSRSHAASEHLSKLHLLAISWKNHRDAFPDTTSCEFALLAALAERTGQVVGREELLELARGTAEHTFARAIDVQISRLRVKLHDDPREPRILKTVRGVGYVLVAAEVAGSAP